jgi:hypothetical protein
MELLEGLHRHFANVTRTAGATTELFLYLQLLILLQNPMRLLLFASEPLRLPNDNDAAPTVATIADASASEGPLCLNSA